MNLEEKEKALEDLRVVVEGASKMLAVELMLVWKDKR